jgi:hypothetical protein
VSGDEAHEEPGNAAGDGREGRKAGGKGEDPRCYERASHPGEWADRDAVVLEELPVKQDCKQREERADDQGLYEQRPPEEPLIHSGDSREAADLDVLQRNTLKARRLTWDWRPAASRASARRR